MVLTINVRTFYFMLY